MNDLNVVIYLNLLFLIPISDLCLKIINLKEIYELNDTLNYHVERWETISSKYFRSFEFNQWNDKIIYSYIYNNNNYMANIDKNKDFYYETTISYQNRDLLMSLINTPKEYRKITDILYGKLSKKIHKLMSVGGPACRRDIH